MYGITIVDRGSPAVDRLSALVRGPQLANRYVGAVARLVTANFRALDGERANQMGGKRTHFYAEAAKGTTWKADAEGGTVTVHSTGIAQRLFGGTIVPVNRKFLAIPARAEAYGHSPRDFNDLEPHFGEHGGALVQRIQGMKSVADTRKGRKGQRRDVADHTREQGLVFFWLVKSVTQQPDETVLPPMDDMHLAGRLAVEDLIRKVLNTPINAMPAEET